MLSYNKLIEHNDRNDFAKWNNTPERLMMVLSKSYLAGALHSHICCWELALLFEEESYLR